MRVEIGVGPARGSPGKGTRGPYKGEGYERGTCTLHRDAGPRLLLSFSAGEEKAASNPGPRAATRLNFQVNFRSNKIFN